MTYEFFDHTADLGLRVRAESLEGVFVEAARGLFAALVANPEAIQARSAYQVRLSASRLDDLLYDWLSELLYVFDTKRLVFAEFIVNLSTSNDFQLEGQAKGESFDPTRHEPHLEIKAITYHRLRVEQMADGRWEAEIIADL